MKGQTLQVFGQPLYSFLPLPKAHWISQSPFPPELMRTRNKGSNMIHSPRQEPTLSLTQALPRPEREELLLQPHGPKGAPHSSHNARHGPLKACVSPKPCPPAIKDLSFWIDWYSTTRKIPWCPSQRDSGTEEPRFRSWIHPWDTSSDSTLEDHIHYLPGFIKGWKGLIAW